MSNWIGDILGTNKNNKLDIGEISRSADWDDNGVVYKSSQQTWEDLSTGGSSETVTCDKLKVDGIDVGATLKTLQSRFLILEEDFQKHEQYPALKAAYEQYKIIEKLLLESDKKAK